MSYRYLQRRGLFFAAVFSRVMVKFCRCHIPILSIHDFGARFWCTFGARFLCKNVQKCAKKCKEIVFFYVISQAKSHTFRTVKDIKSLNYNALTSSSG